MEKRPDLLEVILCAVCMLLFLSFILTKRGLDGEAAGKDERRDGSNETGEIQRMEEFLEQAAQKENRQAAHTAGQTPQEEAQERGAKSDVDLDAGESTVEGSGVSPRIRVLIRTDAYAGYYHDELTLSGSSPIHLNGEACVAAAGEAVTVKRDSPWFQEGHIQVRPEDENAGITLKGLVRAQENPVYEGTFDIYATEQGLLLVNELDLETYLRYVVPSEMPASYSEEALKAQAVCARTYAWSQIQKDALSAYHAHVDDSVSYQVYHNMSPQEATDRAVAATRGEIMESGGEPITAYFFSTSCGYTSTDEVWNASEPEAYLKSVCVSRNPAPEIETEEAFASFIRSREETDYESGDGWYRWSVTLPADVISERLKERGIGQVTGLLVQKRSAGGAVEQLEVIGSKGTVLLENEYEIRQFLSAKGYPIAKNDGTTATEMALLPSAYFVVSPVEQGGEVSGFSFQGGGYGHGVGMSQNGAKHMAEQGKSYQEILNFFYDRITIQKISG